MAFPSPGDAPSKTRRSHRPDATATLIADAPGKTPMRPLRAPAGTRIGRQPDTYRHVTEKLGYQQTPVITVKLEGQRTVHWGGHRMDMLVRPCAEGVASDHKEASR